MTAGKQKPNWILFDAVGTLLFPEPDVAVVYANIARDHGINLSAADIAPRMAMAIQVHFASSQSNEQTERRHWRQVVSDVFGAEGTRLFRHLWDHFAQPGSWRLFGDVLPTWRWLEQHDYRIAIASNFDRRLTAITDQLPPLNRAEHVFYSSRVGYRKPCADFFRGVAESLGEHPQSLLLVGDSLRADYEGARQAGWQALHLCRSAIHTRYPTIVQLTDVVAWLDAVPGAS